MERADASSRQGGSDYIVDCNRGLNSYFVNSQQEVVYYRPQTITGSRRFARRSPLSDYEFSTRPAHVVSAPLPKEMPA